MTLLRRAGAAVPGSLGSVSELRVHGMAAGGEGVARDSHGRVVFIRGALPGDLVEVAVESERKRFARASVLRVIEVGPSRQEPGCRHVLDGCGGCDLQHAQPIAQHELKRQVVADTLERIGRIPSPDVRFGGAVPPEGYRTTVRAAVVDGIAGFRARSSHDVVRAPDCRVAHPTVRAILAAGRFPGASEVLVRVGVDSADPITVVTPTATECSVPLGRLVGASDLTPGGELGEVFEDLAGHRFRISASSFFQSGPAAAELLITTVDAAVGQFASSGTLAALYSGVGLFAAATDFDGPRMAVEINPSAVADARVNLANRDIEIVESNVERWRPRPADVVIADPARRGLDTAGVATVAATGARHVVLVSCDPGALGRDTKLLVEAGYEFGAATVLDLFPSTSHVEAVAVFTRSVAPNPHRPLDRRGPTSSQ